MGLTSTILMQLAPEDTGFGKIMQNNHHVRSQGDSKSPILVPMKSQYASSCVWIIVTYLLSCTVSEILGISGEIFGVDGGEFLSSMHLFGLNL